MPGQGSPQGAARRALRRYLVATAAVLLLAVAGSVLGAWWFATLEAREEARDLARSFARTVMAPLRVDDVGRAGSSTGSSEARDTLAAAVEGLRAEGDVYRVKVWRLDAEVDAGDTTDTTGAPATGPTVEVVYSDVPELEGLRVPVGPSLARALETGEPVVAGVPDDAAHATELSAPVDLLEVYLPFVDADGHRAVVELYLVTQTGERTRELLAHVLPLAVVPAVVLAAATLPLALRLARRFADAEKERRELLARALAASEAERRALARRLHDGLVQDLAALRLALEAGAASSDRLDAVRADLAARVEDELAELRGVLDDLNPPGLEAGDLREAFEAFAGTLVADLVVDDAVDGARAPEVSVVGEPLADVGPGTRTLLHRSGTELLRNAVAHGGARHVEVELFRTDEGPRGEPGAGVEVRDDGAGFDPGDVPTGHHGLRLVRAAVEEAGGVLEVETGPSGTRARVVLRAAR